jgi:tRNA-specific 2-thiouridylase
VKKKAIALVSGGLDSLLAAKITQGQGVDVLGLVFVMQFASRDIKKFKAHVKEAAAEADIPIRFVDISKEFLEVVKAPKHGYGAHMNPCIDCKILMLKAAKEIMRDEKAAFVLTGEVLGERPMSQRKAALDMIEKNSSLTGYLLRPLSAKLLKETVPEKEGIVDRAKLFDIEGRSREPQLKLARKYGITKFFAPAGGCLLTDPVFARKLKDLVSADRFAMDEVSLLKYGRHFRLDPATKAVVGRDEKENDRLQELKKEGDVLIRLEDKAGPYAIIRGNTTAENIKKTASLVLSHSKYRNEDGTEVEYWIDPEKIKTIAACSITADEIKKLRI